MEIECPKCKQGLQAAKSNLVGVAVICPTCNTCFTVYEKTPNTYTMQINLPEKQPSPCKACGKSIPEGARFCMSCGTPSTNDPNTTLNQSLHGANISPDSSIQEQAIQPESNESRTCPQCGEKVLKVARKCKHCGASLAPVVAADAILACALDYMRTQKAPEYCTTISINKKLLTLRPDEAMPDDVELLNVLIRKIFNIGNCVGLSITLKGIHFTAKRKRINVSQLSDYFDLTRTGFVGWGDIDVVSASPNEDMWCSGYSLAIDNIMDGWYCGTMTKSEAQYVAGLARQIRSLFPAFVQQEGQMNKADNQEYGGHQKKGGCLGGCLRWGCGGILLYIGFMWMLSDGIRGCNSGASSDAQQTHPASVNQQSSTTKDQSPTSVVIPQDQQAFINAVVPFIKKYKDASNELKKSAVRADRKEALRNAMPSTYAHNWVGRLKKLSTTSKGEAYVDIALEGAADITIYTWDTSLFEMTDDMLINQNSELYKRLSNMSEGTLIVFSGTFKLGDIDYIKESSITESGSMTDPEFIMKVEDISIYSPPAAPPPVLSPKTQNPTPVPEEPSALKPTVKTEVPPQPLSPKTQPSALTVDKMAMPATQEGVVPQVVTMAEFQNMQKNKTVNKETKSQNVAPSTAEITASDDIDKVMDSFLAESDKAAVSKPAKPKSVYTEQPSYKPSTALAKAPEAAEKQDAVSLTGNIMQIIDSKRLLLQLVISKAVWSDSEGSATVMTGSREVAGEVVSIIMDSTDKMVDNQRVYYADCSQTGTFKYRDISGVTRTVKEYKTIRPASQKDYNEPSLELQYLEQELKNALNSLQ